MEKLFVLQVSVFVLIIAGAVIRKTGLIGEQGKKNITDLVIYMVLPCNIFKSFCSVDAKNMLSAYIIIFIISILIQFGCTLIGKVLYRKIPDERRKCLHYATICSNAGFMGNPIAEGLYGAVGLSLASVYLIPQRVIMWSAGISLFSNNTDIKKLIKKVITHPCILACILGIIVMISEVHIPDIVMQPITLVSNCNTALSMIVIGTILANINLKKMIDKAVVLFTVLRLAIIPGLVYTACLLANIDNITKGVSVILAAMPAGATTSILAAKYECDEEFATKLVMFSTAMSMISIPVWSVILNI